MSRSVLVTGASSGIGAACAARLKARGDRVFGTSRHPREASPDANGIEWVALDVGDEASVHKAVDQVLGAAGRIDALVCNAGFGIFGSVEEVPMEAAQHQLDTNYFGVLRCVRAVLPHMREARAGRILLVGSLAARAPIPFQSHYSASKAAVEATALALYNEVRPYGIHVTLIEPGDINTPFNDAMTWQTSEQEAASAYADRLRTCERVIRESLPKAPGPEVIASAVERALGARKPRVRYTAGAESRLVPLARRLLPDSIALRFIRDHFKV